MDSTSFRPVFFPGTELKAQLTRQVLFLGNSYTAVNNLPQLVHDVALSAGDTMVFDSNAPGGYQLINHSLDSVSLNKILAGGWDYVILQGQSQEPIVATSQFTSGASALFNLIKQSNPCAVAMPYMTWGRKNGDAANCPFFPVMCTYQGMDTTLRMRYLTMTASINGEVSPVSVVWNYLRQNYPNIELYQADESHPSAAGSYAAACSFYASIFKKDPALITYDFGLDTAAASTIRNAAKVVVFDSLPIWDYKKLPIADIRYHIGPGMNEAIFGAVSHGVRQNYFWDFDDGDTASISHPTHNYSADGAYTVSLTTTTCDLQGLHIALADTLVQFCSHTPAVYSSQAWLCQVDTLWTQPADAYQWFIYDSPLPETTQYLPTYAYAGFSGITVLSSLNGCSELSQPFNGSAVSSGYYFDVMGNPCAGDTVAFAVLNTSGFLRGTQTILWFKNDTLLPGFTNDDTLFIAEEGTFECKVTDAGSICPLDTTRYSIEYDCGPAGIREIDKSSWSLFPNPASEKITLECSDHPRHDVLQIYSASGVCLKEMKASKSMEINIAALPPGIYLLRMKNSNRTPLKFIKL
jgi:hypothetical protein